MTTYHITAAAKRIGISTPTLKRWLLSGKVEEVRKDRNGWRVFTEEDIDRIREFRFRKRRKQLTINEKRETLTIDEIEDYVKRELEPRLVS